MEWRKLLCPIDFSGDSELASRLALRLAEKAGASVTLAHVVHPVYWLPDMAIGDGDIRAAVERAVDEALAARRDDVCSRSPGVPVEVARVEGVPWRGIVDLAEREAFDVIVMGTRGRTGIKHVLGSVAERVVRHAACPVMVVRGRLREEGPLFGAILCAVDFSEATVSALRQAAALATMFDASLSLQHVDESPAYPMPSPVAPSTVQAAVARSKAMLASLHDEATRLGVQDVRSVWTEGTPWHEIAKHAEDYGHDLIVVGTHGRTGVKHALIGSVAERVVRHAPCTVLTVREP